MDGNGGIQQLLAAEQEAQAIIKAARDAKAERLKQAKDEAAREVTVGIDLDRRALFAVRSLFSALVFLDPLTRSLSHSLTLSLSHSLTLSLALHSRSFVRQAFKQELEAQYAASMDADASENATTVDKLRAESDAEISKVTRSMGVNKQRVLDMLLTQVKTVKTS